MPHKIMGPPIAVSKGTFSAKIREPRIVAIMGSPKGTDAIVVGVKYLIA